MRQAWRYLPLGLIGLALAAFFATGAGRSLSPEMLLEHRETLQAYVRENPSLALLAYMGIYVTAATLSIPVGVILMILGGFLFGWLVGGAAAVISATLGAIGIFLIARTSIGDALVERAGDRVRRLAEGFRRDAFAYLLFLRLSPFPYWITNLASALFGVPLRVYAPATLAGLIPVTFAFAVGGSGLDDVVAEKQAARDACLAGGGTECPLSLSPTDVLTVELAFAIGVLALLSLAPVVLRLFGGRRLAWLAGHGKR